MKNRRNFIKNSALCLLGWGSVSETLLNQKDIGTAADLSQSKNDEQLFTLIKKSLLLSPDLVYLNTGSLGPSPGWLVHRMSHLTNDLESNPVSKNWGKLGQEMETTREIVATFINAEKEEIVLTRNTTEGINLICSALKLHAGDEILTTTHEHGGGENGLEYIAGEQGLSVRKMDLPMPIKDKNQLIDFIKKQISPKTKLLMLSHISTITGLRMPFDDIASITRPKGILLVADGAQAPGMIGVDVKKMGVDIYSASGHKWLLGPKETGFLFIRDEIKERIQSFFTRKGTAVYSASSGTRNVATIIGLGEIMKWHQLIGKDKVEAKGMELANYCRAQLQELKQIEIISPEPNELSGSIVSILLNNKEKSEIFSKLKAQQIIIKQLPKYNALRFSTHIFNTEEEVDRMANALGDLVTG